MVDVTLEPDLARVQKVAPTLRQLLQRQQTRLKRQKEAERNTYHGRSLTSQFKLSIIAAASLVEALSFESFLLPPDLPVPSDSSPLLPVSEEEEEESRRRLAAPLGGGGATASAAAGAATAAAGATGTSTGSAGGGFGATGGP